MAEDAIKAPEVASPNHKPNGDFAAGNRANPKGRPKKTHSVSSMLRELIDSDPKRTAAKWKRNHQTGAMLVAMALFQKMIKGDLTAIHEGLNRLEGRVPQRQELTGAEGGPIRHEQEYDFSRFTEAQILAAIDAAEQALGAEG